MHADANCGSPLLLVRFCLLPFCAAMIVSSGIASGVFGAGFNAATAPALLAALAKACLACSIFLVGGLYHLESTDPSIM